MSKWALHFRCWKIRREASRGVERIVQDTTCTVLTTKHGKLSIPGAVATWARLQVVFGSTHRDQPNMPFLLNTDEQPLFLEGWASILKASGRPDRGTVLSSHPS